MSQPMYRGGQSQRPSGAVGLVTSLAVFALVCGLIMLIAGDRPAGKASPEKARHERMVSATKAATKAGNRAKNALDGANYGAAKQIIEDLQKQVTRLQIELEAATPAGSGK